VRARPDDPQSFLTSGSAVSAIGLFGIIGDRHDDRVIDPLLTILSSDNLRFAAAAGRALGQLGVDRAVQPLIAMLQQHRNDDAVVALGLLRASEAVEPLVDALKKSKRYGKPAFAPLAAALARIGDRRAIEPLAQLLDRPNVALAAALALSRLGDDRGLTIILAAVESPDPDWDAARRLAELGDQRGVEAMLKQYGQNLHSYPSHTRDINGRHALLRDLSRSGELYDIPFLERVQAYDFERTDQGWSLAEAASRAIERIRARHHSRAP
jgi:HEAT repeat protein